MQKDKYESLIKNLALDNVVIYGLSTRAEACYDWFATHFPTAKIIGFIPESPTEKQTFCDIPVLSIDDIKQRQEAAIIYAERDVLGIESLKIKHSLKNDFYIFYYVKPFSIQGTEIIPNRKSENYISRMTRKPTCSLKISFWQNSMVGACSLRLIALTG